jgi:Uma2 family endonuclease
LACSLDEVDYERAHPSQALLIVEVASSSLAQDRLTKSRIYAAAGVPEYWIVNLRDDALEVHRHPDASAARYAEEQVLRRGERVSLAAFPDVSFAVAQILPLEPPTGDEPGGALAQPSSTRTGKRSK